jgi:hypothetical protein
LYFSDLKQNSYDFSKFLIFFDISNNMSLMNQSIGLMVIRDEWNFANSGDVWPEGTERFARLEAPRLDSLL